MSDKPDIIWIYCDELRTDALVCYGHPRIQPQQKMQVYSKQHLHVDKEPFFVPSPGFPIVRA